WGRGRRRLRWRGSNGPLRLAGGAGRLGGPAGHGPRHVPGLGLEGRSRRDGAPLAAVAAPPVAAVAGPAAGPVVPPGRLIPRPGEEGRVLFRQRVALQLVARAVGQLHVGQGIGTALADGNDVVLGRFLQGGDGRSEEQRLNSSHVKISYAVFCLKKKIHSSCS